MKIIELSIVEIEWEFERVIRIYRSVPQVMFADAQESDVTPSGHKRILSDKMFGSGHRIPNVILKEQAIIS